MVLCTLLAPKKEINEPISIRLDCRGTALKRGHSKLNGENCISDWKIAKKTSKYTASSLRVRQWTFLPSNPINNNKAKHLASQASNCLAATAAAISSSHLHFIRFTGNYIIKFYKCAAAGFCGRGDGGWWSAWLWWLTKWPHGNLLSNVRKVMCKSTATARWLSFFWFAYIL